MGSVTTSLRCTGFLFSVLFFLILNLMIKLDSLSERNSFLFLIIRISGVVLETLLLRFIKLLKI